jgi:ribosome biogenesis GTPase / thiamine phosphate phosphatase
MPDQIPLPDTDGPTAPLSDLGWSMHFADQWDQTDGMIALRITSVQRALATGLGPSGEHMLGFPPDLRAGGLAVGDWVLADPATGRIARVLDRQSILSRRAAGIEAKPQLLAANVDTLFITTSCNADFNPARLERYLVLALDSGITPVIVLTKSDQTDAIDSYLAQARALSDKIAAVVALNAKDPEQVSRLSHWCGPGRTVAFVGSSGVGKSTLINALTGSKQATAAMRQDDAKGRHTTTARSLHLMAEGGLVIDMPGMRELGLHDVAGGIDELFGDITALTETCRFRDCKHVAEPGCAVRQAVEDGTLDPSRLERWRKLKSEDAMNTTSMTVSRREARALARAHRTAQEVQRSPKGTRPGKPPRKG